jgi:hypothetical protein
MGHSGPPCHATSGHRAQFTAQARPYVTLVVSCRAHRHDCRMDLPRPTASVGTRTDYSVDLWDYSTCAARYLMA